jgi:hypothetical protein
MSKRSLSDAQLDAMAAGARPRTDWTIMGLSPAVLYCKRTNHGVTRAADQYGTWHDQWCCYVAEARHTWARELPPQLHVRHVPSEAVPVTVSEWSVTASGYILTEREEFLLDAGIGVPFHPAFAGLIDDKPRELLQRKLVQHRRNVCEAKHRTYVDHAGKPLCDTLLRLVIQGRYPLPEVARRLQLTPERVESHLLRALRDVWGWRRDELNELSGRRVQKEAA